MEKLRLIAFYLPQYHPIPENDQWWGNGFTEWTNVTKAKPLYKGHTQPKLPSDLGFYDLRVPEVRELQAELARSHGIGGFCYWHYWFGNGKMLLERPFEEVLKSGKPDFPFCLGWANHSWTGVWDADPNRKLIEQAYPGMKDHEVHFYYWLKAFSDNRYIKVEKKPLLVLFRPYEIPECRAVIDLWRNLAIKEGLDGLFIVGLDVDKPSEFGLDASSYNYHRRVANLKPKKHIERIYRRLTGQMVNVYTYKEAMPFFLDGTESELDRIPTIVTNWDNTPRMGKRGVVIEHTDPEFFRTHVQQCFDLVKEKPDERKIIFVKSWNEWAEGNYLEPDQIHGKALLKIICEEVNLWKEGYEKPT